MIPVWLFGRPKSRLNYLETRHSGVPVVTRNRLLITALVAVCLVGMAFAAIGLSKAQHHNPGIQAVVIYTAPTANDAAVNIPESVTSELKKVGLAYGKVAVNRVESTGNVETSVVDLTPRDEPDGPILKVDARANEAVDTAISKIEQDINNRSAATGSRSLYGGLLKTTFAADVPVFIFSSGLARIFRGMSCETGCE